MAKSVKDIIESIRDGLTGEYEIDRIYLEGQVEKYRGTKNGKEIESAIADIAYEILPADKREQMNKMMYLDGKRLDAVFAEAAKLTDQKKTEESFKLTEALYTKIRMNYRETEEEVYLSMRNVLEHQLYLYFYQPTKKLVRPVFDLSQIVLLHGFNLLELHRGEEAVKVIGDAIRYNPMNVDAYLELAECYKALEQPENLLSTIKEALEIAVTPRQISHCYCDLGFYCIEVKDYDNAVCFYYESLIYDDNPFVPAELHHIYTITQKKIAPPSKDRVAEAFKHYGIEQGANKDILNVIANLAMEAMEKKDLPACQFYQHMLYGLTNDPDVKETMERYDLIAKERGESIIK